MIKVTLVKSPIGNQPDQRATVRAMGLRKMHHSVLMPDNDATKGMIYKVRHLVTAEKVDD